MAAEAEVQKNRESINTLSAEVQRLTSENAKVRKLKDENTLLKTEKSALQQLHDRFREETERNRVKMVEKIDALEGKLNLVTEKANKDAEEAEAAMKASSDLAEAREQRIKNLENDLEELRKDRDYQVDAKEELEDGLSELADRLEIVRASLKENEETFHEWRPDIYQKSFDLCREQVLAGADPQFLPEVVEPPPGWWGDARPCLPGQPFVDIGATPDSESSDDDDEEVPEEVPTEIPAPIVATLPSSANPDTPSGHVEDLTHADDSDI
jgi:hypothetical protein